MENLGREAAINQSAFQTILPDLFRHNANGALPFGIGLAQETQTHEKLWEKMLKTFSEPEVEKRNFNAFLGFLIGVKKRSPQLCNALLDRSIACPIIANVFPQLQIAVGLDKRGVERLKKSLSLGKASGWAFRSLAYGRAADTIPTKTFCSLVRRIASLEDGFSSATLIFDMRLQEYRTQKRTVAPALRKCGRDIFREFVLPKDHHDSDYHRDNIVRECFRGIEGEAITRLICRKLLRANEDQYSVAWDCRSLISCLLSVQPEIALEIFLGKNPKQLSSSLIESHGYDEFDDKNHPLSLVPAETLLSWAKKDLSTRLPRLAKVVPAFMTDSQTNQAAWTPIALRIVEIASDPIKVLEIFASRFRPSSWSGSLAATLEQRRSLPRFFLSDPRPEVVKWAREADEGLESQTVQARKLDRRSDETFE